MQEKNCTLINSFYKTVHLVSALAHRCPPAPLLQWNIDFTVVQFDSFLILIFQVKIIGTALCSNCDTLFVSVLKHQDFSEFDNYLTSCINSQNLSK